VLLVAQMSDYGADRTALQFAVWRPLARRIGAPSGLQMSGTI
jgi:hypothetical protein